MEESRPRAERLVDSLAEQGVMICPDCATGRLGAAAAGGRRCAACGRVFPERHGVVDFLDYCAEPPGTAARPTDAVVSAIIAGTGLDDTPRTRRAVEEIYERTSRRTGSAQHTAEIHDILDRFGIAPAPAGAAHGALGRLAGRWSRLRRRLPASSRGVAAAVERHYVGGRLPAGTTLHRNVRVRNTGTRAWRAAGPKAMRLSQRWLGEDGVDARGGPDTALPIDIEPGRAITLPLRIDTPAGTGRLRLRVTPVLGNRRIEAAGLDLDVELVPHLDTAASAVTVSRQPMSYAEDHAAGQQMLRAHLARRYGDRPIRILEIGSGTHPQSPWVATGEVVNIDISAPMLELGSLHYEQHAARVAFLCCDALRPPLADASFDGVVMFATLHHFAEPEVLLGRSRRLLVEGGFVAVMCEPVDTDLSAAEVIRDLGKGIDEQVFSIDEYLAVFAAAGLEIDEARLDGGSFKAILSADRRPGPGATAPPSAEVVTASGGS